MVTKIIILTSLFFVSSLEAGVKCYDTSERITIEKGISEFNGLIPSPDQSKLLATDENTDEVSVIDLKTGEKKLFKKPLGSIATFNSNNEIIYQGRISSGVSDFNSFKNKLSTFESTIIDLNTGKVRKTKGIYIDRLSGHAGNSPKIIGNNIYFYNSGKFAFRYNIKIFSDDHDIRVVQNPKENASDIIIKHGDLGQEISIADINGKEVAKFQAQSLNEEGNLTDDNLIYFAKGFKNNKAFVFKYDIKNNSSTEIQIPEGYYAGYDKDFDPIWKNTKTFNRKTNQIMLSPTDGNKPLATLDLKSGEAKYYPNLNITEATFDEKGNVCGYFKTDLNIFKCFDSSEQEISSNHIGMNSEIYALSFLGDKKAFISIRSLRQDERMATVIIPSKKCISFDDTEFLNMKCKYLQSENTTQIVDDIYKLSQALVCDKDYDANKWRLKSKDFTPFQAQIWLTKFAKPNGFDLENDLEVLEKIFFLKLNEKFPNEFSAAMLGILKASPSVYNFIINSHPDLKLSPTPALNCLTQNEKQALRKSVADYLSYFTFLNGKSIDNYENLQPLLSLFSDQEKEDFADKFADQILRNIGHDHQLNGIFSSKLYKFYFNSLKKKFGAKYNDLNDVTYIRTPEALKLVQLSLTETPGTHKTSSGLFLNEFKNLENSSLVPNVPTETGFNWVSNGSSFKAKISVKKIHPKDELVAKAPSPDYKKMCNGQCMNGLIIAGSNLGKDLADSVVRSYIDYYIKEGFEFGSPKKFENMESYLKDKISGKNPVHYLVKEAHSDGDEKSLFRMSTKGKVLTGTRVKNGFREIIEIAYPAEEHGETKLISNDKFGQWVKDREAKSTEPLVYLNSSCWSAFKAINEITSASSPLLVNIPTTTSMTVFSNKKDNVMRIVVDGLRNKKSYEEMRKQMNKDPEYSSKKGNVFIFPDEDAYSENITKYILEPINVDIDISTKTVQDQNWRHYSIEDQH